MFHLNDILEKEARDMGREVRLVNASVVELDEGSLWTVVVDVEPSDQGDLGWMKQRRLIVRLFGVDPLGTSLIVSSGFAKGEKPW